MSNLYGEFSMVSKQQLAVVLIGLLHPFHGLAEEQGEKLKGIPGAMLDKEFSNTSTGVPAGCTSGIFSEVKGLAAACGGRHKRSHPRVHSLEYGLEWQPPDCSLAAWPRE